MSAVEPSAAPVSRASRRTLRPPVLRSHELRLYWACDWLSGWLIAFMVVFSPWAFGTTQPATIFVMNVAGYSLGLLLAAKWTIRHLRGYRPRRWTADSSP